MRTHTDNILTSFVLTLLGGTLIRAVFLYINQPTLDIDIYKTFLIGLMIDSLVLSILFLPALFFLVLRIRLSRYLKFVFVLQRLYLVAIIFLFLLSSFVDVFVFQIYQHRLNLSLIEQALNISFSILFNSLKSSFSYKILVVPLLLVIAYGCTCWQVSIEKIYSFFSKRVFCKSQVYKKLSLQQQLQKILIPYLLTFIFTSFIYVPIFFSKSFDQIIYSQQKRYVLQAASKNSFFYLFQKALSGQFDHDGFRKDLMEYKHDFVREDFQKLLQAQEDDIEFISDHNRFLKRLKNPKSELQTKPHIILLNIDSLSQQFLEKGDFLPYLKKMASNGAYFTDFYFHYGGSINSFVSLLFSMPMIYSYTSFIEDVFKKTKKISLMNILRDEGYKSLHVESCSVDDYKTKENFLYYGGDIVIERKDFASPKSSNKEKHICAANDHLLLQKVLSEIKKLYQSTPTFTKINLNNLHFFGNVPNIAKYGYPKFFNVKKYCKIFKDSVYDKKLQNGLCYINFVIKNFVREISDLVGDNLIIVLTGEHRSWEPIPFKEESLRTMQVPLIILDKRGLTLKGVIDKAASHQDVAPTLLYMIGYQGSYPFLGRNLLSQSEKEVFTVFYERDLYNLKKGKYLLEYGNQGSRLFEITKDKMRMPLNNTKLRLKLEKELKQYMAGLAMWNSVDHHHSP